MPNVYLTSLYSMFNFGSFSIKEIKTWQEKLKLRELGSNKKGVDLIINTLSSDHMDSNFKCLNTSGRIKITIRIESGELKLIPITAYSNLDIKEAIEYINKCKHIGKIVLNNDIDILDQLFEIQQNERNSNLSILKSNCQISKDHLGSICQFGIILEIIRWIIKFSENVKNFIIFSKSSMKWGLELLINFQLKEY
ncbi:hypothetical protein ACTA71_005088 [Dictyostelium dimigraforme]